MMAMEARCYCLYKFMLHLYIKVIQKKTMVLIQKLFFVNNSKKLFLNTYLYLQNFDSWSWSCTKSNLSSSWASSGSYLVHSCWWPIKHARTHPQAQVSPTQLLPLSLMALTNAFLAPSFAVHGVGRVSDPRSIPLFSLPSNAFFRSPTSLSRDKWEFVFVFAVLSF